MSIPFETALHCLKKGDFATRDKWNGKCIFIVPEKEVVCAPKNEFNITPGKDFKVLAHIVRETSTKNIFEPWVPRMDDLLAEDWRIIQK